MMRSMRKYGPFVLALLLGCAPVKPKRGAEREGSSAPIDQINLLAIPFAVNFDRARGPDGFVVKVYAGSRDRPKPMAILSGNLEILMYDGILKQNDSAGSPPRRVWKFSAEELKQYMNKSSIGTSYELAARWGEAKPLGDKISVAVRYTAPEGGVIYSAASVISVSAK